MKEKVNTQKETFQPIELVITIENEQDLINLAKSDLEKYYYTGFKGSFLTFGTPFIKFGDNVVLENNILPEQNGTYKVKAVNYSGGENGLRQNIELDYKLNV